jgi:hypothetical protein
VQKFFNP